MEINKLITHYVTNYSSKIFMTRLICDKRDVYIMYVYNYENEIENFSDTFLKYLPFYVRNADHLSSIDESQNIDVQLEQRSKSLRKNSRIIPQRTIATDGIYGELFLDFYLRIVGAKKAILTYANKRSFDTNYETTGPDNIVYYIDDGRRINICLCEAKFVSGASNAKTKLLQDIAGTTKETGHVSKEYLNDYFQFVVEKGTNIAPEDKAIFQPFLLAMNNQLDDGNDFISVLIEHDICVNFIFFAIFDSMKKKPDDFWDYYEEIYVQCKNNVDEMGITNYKIETVFIPTDNRTMEIKTAMEEAYE